MSRNGRWGDLSGSRRSRCRRGRGPEWRTRTDTPGSARRGRRGLLLPEMHQPRRPGSAPTCGCRGGGIWRSSCRRTRRAPTAAPCRSRSCTPPRRGRACPGSPAPAAAPPHRLESPPPQARGRERERAHGQEQLAREPASPAADRGDGISRCRSAPEAGPGQSGDCGCCSRCCCCRDWSGASGGGTAGPPRPG